MHLLKLDSWRQDYARSRYLREAHNDVLDDRLKGLLLNIWQTDAQGQPVSVKPADIHESTMRMIFDVYEEMRARGRTPTHPFADAALLAAATEAHIPAIPTRAYAHQGRDVVKFSEHRYVLDALTTGTLKVSPAQYFKDDPSLNSAQADDELRHHVVTPNERMQIRLYGHTGDGIERELTDMVKFKQLFRGREVSNFLVWCSMLGYDSRMYRDFKGDAALVIHDIDEFLRRFTIAMQRTVPGSVIHYGPVHYYDPYRDRHSDLKPIFSKNFAFAYQREFRVAWTVPAGTTIQTVFPVLGSLEDIAEMLVLPEAAPAA